MSQVSGGVALAAGLTWLCLSEHVLEALLHTQLDLDSLEPDSVLEEEWIKEAVTRSGMKFRWAKLSQSRERPDRDARRRYGGGGMRGETSWRRDGGGETGGHSG